MKKANYMNGLLKILENILTLFAKNAKSSSVDLEKKPIELPENPIYEKPEILFKNDSDRLKTEYKELSTKNRDLLDIIIETAQYCRHTFNKNIVITMIYRTEVEQDSIYKDDPKYKVKKFKSPHQFWDAFDLRSSQFETSEIEKLVNYLNTIYNSTNSYSWTAKNHNIGLGFHFHIQYNKK